MNDVSMTDCAALPIYESDAVPEGWTVVMGKRCILVHRGDVKHWADALAGRAVSYYSAGMRELRRDRRRHPRKPRYTLIADEGILFEPPEVMDLGWWRDDIFDSRAHRREMHFQLRQQFQMDWSKITALAGGVA